MSKASLIVSIVRKGWGNAVLEASAKAGASGGTVIFGRGAGVNEQQRILGIPIEPEKEIVLTVAYSELSDGILREIAQATDLNAPGKGMAFVVPVEKVIGAAHFDRELPPRTKRGAAGHADRPRGGRSRREP